MAREPRAQKATEVPSPSPGGRRGSRFPGAGTARAKGPRWLGLSVFLEQEAAAGGELAGAEGASGRPPWPHFPEEEAEAAADGGGERCQVPGPPGGARAAWAPAGRTHVTPGTCPGRPAVPRPPLASRRRTPLPHPRPSPPAVSMATAAGLLAQERPSSLPSPSPRSPQGGGQIRQGPPGDRTPRPCWCQILLFASWLSPGSCLMGPIRPRSLGWQSLEPWKGVWGRGVGIEKVTSP